MINRLRQYWYDVDSSFWFVPGLIVFVSISLAIVFIEADVIVSSRFIENWPRFLGAGPESSRSILETIASSMIGVAGVVFSITLVALSLASSQYSSRVLRTFMHDRVNQVVLGIFVGIFAYCMIVIRTIRNSEDSFVPAMAVLFGLLLGLAGVAVLIFFIHHIATSIQASRILAAVFEETIENIDVTFPEELDGEEIESNIEPDRPGATWHAVPANRTGYIQQIDTTPLITFARKNRVVVRMERGIGEFLIAGTPAVSVLDTDPPDKQAFPRLNKTFTVGRQRTINQDAAFGIRQLVDVALKALSPGVNDTTTAVMVIDYLTAILVRLADRQIYIPYRLEDSELRLLFRGPTYASLAGEAFRQIRLNAEGNIAVLARLLGSMEILAGKTRDTKRRRILLEHAREIEKTAHRSMVSDFDRRYIQELSARAIASLESDGAGSTDISPQEIDPGH